MQLTRANLADFMYFLAVARHLSFSRAGLEVGISPSALSHAIKALEARLGVRLLNRTTRNVTLTAAGQELLASIREPIDRIDQAMEVLNRYRDEPTGRIRLNVFSDAALLLLAHTVFLPLPAAALLRRHASRPGSECTRRRACVAHCRTAGR